MLQGNQILTCAEKFDIISKNSAEGIIIINDTGIIEEWNDYMVEKTRCSRAEISGKTIWDVQYSILTNEWRNKYPRELLQAIWINLIQNLGENAFITREGQFLSRNNEIIFTEDVICKINLHDKRYLYVIQRDRGARKKMVQEDIMFSVIAFQLRSLIKNLPGYSELFNKEKKRLKIDELVGFVSRVISSSADTVKMVENLLVFLSLQNGNLDFKPVKADLNKIMGNVAGEFKTRALSKNIELNFSPATDCFCYADINSLNVILRNLIDNAIKFSNEDGRVDLFNSVQQDFVEIRIADNGIGINTDNLAKLFLTELNLSTLGTTGEKGSGLGLILCRNLVEKHGGKIWVESEVDKGSVFVFTIPFNLNNLLLSGGPLVQS